MAPIVLLIVFGCIYGGAMFIQFLNYSNEARTIARQIAVASNTKETGETKTPREKLLEYYNGVAEGSLGTLYKVTLETKLIKYNDDGTTEDVPATDSGDATDVKVSFFFDHGQDFPFGFPPRYFATSYRMRLEGN